MRYRPRLSAVTVFPEGVAWWDGDGWRGVPWGIRQVSGVSIEGLRRRAEAAGIESK